MRCVTRSALCKSEGDGDASVSRCDAQAILTAAAKQNKHVKEEINHVYGILSRLAPTAAPTLVGPPPTTCTFPR